MLTLCSMFWGIRTARLGVLDDDPSWTFVFSHTIFEKQLTQQKNKEALVLLAVFEQR
jgi:hypothetical protein